MRRAGGGKSCHQRTAINGLAAWIQEGSRVSADLAGVSISASQCQGDSGNENPTFTRSITALVRNRATLS